MQPYFFPYIGYFQLMQKCDTWVIFDDIQFIDKGWINRNRILHPEIKKKWQFITIPILNKKQFSKIIDLEISNKTDWQKTILGKITFYKKIANFYKNSYDLLNSVLNFSQGNLSKFLICNLEYMKNYLSLELDIVVQSRDLKDINKKKFINPGDWAFEIVKYLEGDIYINPFSGIDLFDPEKFEKNNIQLCSFMPHITKYNQHSRTFVENLSILDYLAWNGKENLLQEITKGTIEKINDKFF